MSNVVFVTGREVWQRNLACVVAARHGVQCAGVTFTGDATNCEMAAADFEAEVGKILTAWSEKCEGYKAKTRTFRWNPLVAGKSKYERHPKGQCSEWDFMTTSQRRSARLTFCATAAA